MPKSETHPAPPLVSVYPALAAWTSAWAELFLLIPLHAFWVLYKSTPFVAENTGSAFVAAVPFGAIVVIGAALGIRPIRAAFVGVERWLHVTAAFMMALVLLYVAVRDPLAPMFPISWPLVLWSIAISFAAIADLATHERVRRTVAASRVDRYPWFGTIGMGVAVWAIAVWIAAGANWIPYFLTVSAVFHAGMALAGRDAGLSPTDQTISGRRRFDRAVAFVESLFAIALVFAALLRFLFTCNMIGTAELKYFQFVDLAATPWFMLGAAVAAVAARFRFTFVTHAAAMGIVVFAGVSSNWPTPLVLGYALPVLCFAAMREGALSYALSAGVSTVAVMFGLFAFMLAGLVVVHEIGLDFAKDLTFKMQVAIPVLYVLWLTLLGLRLGVGKLTSEPEPIETPPPSRRATVLTLVAVRLLVIVPLVCIVARTMWPPVWFDVPERIEVGEATGVCHAGYSRTDEEYAVLDELGVRLMRVDFHWTGIQPDPDTWDFDRFDKYTASAKEHGVEVLALLDFDNNAVEQSPEGARPGPYIAPGDIPLFLEYVRRTVGRYKDRVAAWEIWNEPDIDRFWAGTMDEFYELARRTAATVREVDPDATILGTAMTGPMGALSPEGIEGMHASGALDQVDHPTMHMYVTDPRAYYGEFWKTRNAAAKYGHEGTIWITELGDPDGGVYPWRASSDLLAEHAIKSHTIATAVGIEKLIWYCYRDADAGSQRKSPENSEGFFGLIGPDGRWKPTAHAYSLFAKYCSESTIRRDMLSRSGGLAARQLRAVLYRRENGDSALVLWFEPSLRSGAHARVRIDLGELAEPAVMHEITSSYSKELLDPVVDVTEKPLFITFKAPAEDTPVTLHVDSSPADAMWLLCVFGLVAWAGVVVWRECFRSSTSVTNMAANR